MICLVLQRILRLLLLLKRLSEMHVLALLVEPALDKEGANVAVAGPSASLLVIPQGPEVKDGALQQHFPVLSLFPERRQGKVLISGLRFCLDIFS